MTISTTPGLPRHEEGRGQPKPEASFAHQPGWRRVAARAAAGPTSLKSRVLAEVRRAPGSCEDIARRLGVTVWNVRPRCSELETAARIRDSGARGLSASGRRVIIWQAVER